MMDRTAYVQLIEKVLTAKELDYIVARVAKPGSELIDYHVRPASEEGMKGFVGDHFRMTMTIKENDCLQKIELFIKTLPIMNKPKADFIVRHQFFKREALMFKLLDDMQMDSQSCWHTTAFVHNDKVLVMPDLAVQGYETHPVQKYFDKIHILATVSSVARFHASFTNDIIEKRLNKNCAYDFLGEHGDIMTEPIFCESPWLRAAAKLTNNFLREFSPKRQQYPADLEENLWKLFKRGCESVREYKNTLNVIIHKDLWANNILFQYSGEQVKNAVLVDFQCIRFAPPAFDLMALLYLTTSRSFREHCENEVLHYYYSIFSESIDDQTKKRLRDLKYDREAFLVWCGEARLFGMIVAIGIFPFILMEPSTARLTFDDPITFSEYLEEDRSGPVITHACENVQYRNRQLEVCEEFLEKYLT